MAEALGQEMSSLREQGCWWLKFKRVLNDLYSQLCAVSMKPVVPPPSSSQPGASLPSLLQSPASVCSLTLAELNQRTEDIGRIITATLHSSQKVKTTHKPTNG